MPSVISHWLLGKRVLPLLREREDLVLKERCFLWGCQGPDILNYHKLMPWRGGTNLRRFVKPLHEVDPSVLFSALASPPAQLRGELSDHHTSYALGMCCHYALDSIVEPYIERLEDHLRKTDPRGKKYNYRADIESALDVMLLRHDKNLLPDEIKLVDCVPTGRSTSDAVSLEISYIIESMFGVCLAEGSAKRLANDVRTAMHLMNDPHGRRKGVVSSVEKLVNVSGGKTSSYFRPMVEDLECDYANLLHGEWSPISDPSRVSRDDYFMMADKAEKYFFTVADIFLNALREGEKCSIPDFDNDGGDLL